MLSKKDIEELATGAVKRYFNTCNLISPQIQENDKTPDWDANHTFARTGFFHFRNHSRPIGIHFALKSLSKASGRRLGKCPIL